MRVCGRVGTVCLCLLHEAAHGVRLCRGIASGDGGKGCLGNGCLQWLNKATVA